MQAQFQFNLKHWFWKRKMVWWSSQAKVLSSLGMGNLPRWVMKGFQVLHFLVGFLPHLTRILLFCSFSQLLCGSFSWRNIFKKRINFQHFFLFNYCACHRFWFMYILLSLDLWSPSAKQDEDESKKEPWLDLPTPISRCWIQSDCL